MNDETLNDLLFLTPREFYDSCILALDFDQCFIIYDADLIIEKLTIQESLKYPPDEAHLNALDHFCTNIIGSNMGIHTPRYATTRFKELFETYTNEN